MQLYAIKLHNFLRFGESENTWVLDVNDEEFSQMKSGKLTMDQLYDKFSKNAYSRMKQMGVLSDLIGIEGRREDDPSKSNGSGKSSIFEGVCYLFYEKTVRQVANTDKTGNAGLSVVSKFGNKYPEKMKESYVEGYFEENGRFYRCKRGRTFTKSKKSSSPLFELEELFDESSDNKHGHRTTDSKLSLEDILSRDYDIFSNADMFGQNDFGKFLMGSDKQKKEMILKLVNQDKLVVNGIEKIRKDKNDLSKKVTEFQSTISYIESEILKYANKYGIENSCEDVKTIIVNISKELKEKKIKINEENVKLDKISKKIIESINNLKNDSNIIKADNIKEKGISLKKQLEEKKSHCENISKDIAEEEDSHKKYLERQDQRISKINSEIIEIKNLLETTKKDASKFSKEDYDKKISEIDYDENEKVKLDSETKKIDKEKTILEVELNSLKIEFNNRKDRINKFNKDLNSGVEKFICPECESEVPMSHFEEKIKKLNEENNDVKAKGVKIKDRISEIEKSISKNNDLLNLCKGKKEKIEKLQNEKILKENKFQRSKDIILSKKSELKSKEEMIGEINEERKLNKEKFEKKILNYNKSKKEELEKIDLLKKELEEIKSQYSLIQMEAKKSYDKIERLEKDLNQNNNLIKLNNNELGGIDSDVKSLKSLYNDYKEKGKDLLETQKSFQRKLILEKIFGLQGLQTRIASSYLPALNIYVKEFLDILSNGLVSVNFSINKSGQIDMDIEGGISDEYIMLSGGEKMVIRVAVDIGLSLLSCQTTSQSPSAIWLDEIFAPLDESHTESVFKILDLLKDKFNRVLLITHQYGIYDRMSKMLVVEKESGKYGRSKIKGYK